MNRLFSITDDAGFIALVDAHRYDAFVRQDWTFDDLRARFIREMRRRTLLIWATGIEGIWNVRITTDAVEHQPLRTLEARIDVTDGKLFLTSYDDLSMAAQFPDESLPQKHNADLVFDIENGTYDVRVHQLYDPDDPGLDFTGVHFEISIAKAMDGSVDPHEFEEIPWLR